MRHADMINEIKTEIKKMYDAKFIKDSDTDIIVMDVNNPFTLIFTFDMENMHINVVKMIDQLASSKYKLLKILNQLNSNETTGSHSINFQYGFYSYRATFDYNVPTKIRDYVIYCIGNSNDAVQQLFI